MPRRVEDIVRNERRTIREVSVDKPARPKASRSSPSRSESEEEVPIKRMKVTPPPTRPVARKDRKSAGRKMWIIIAAAVIVLVAGTAAVSSIYYSRATFNIVPVSIPVTVSNSTIVATGTSTAGYLKYDTAKFTGVASTTVTAIDGAYTSTKASGQVTLYNSYAAEGQRLLAGTRLSNDSGFVYRLVSSVFVPGYKSSNGNKIAGSLKADVIADKPGAQYNIKKTEGTGELRIIAYTGGPRYDTVYARLLTDIIGGYEGTKKTVDPKLLASTTANLQEVLRKALLSQALGAVPPGYVTYDTAYTTSYTAPVLGGTSPKVATVTVSATLYNILFKKTDLMGKLAGQQNVERFGKSAYSTPGLESLKFLITNPDTFKPAKQSTLIARLNGNVTMKGTIPVSELKTKLAGMSLADTRAIFGSYSTVVDVGKSSGELFPSWASKVPSDQSRINIEVKD